jgi:hypothetical protein
MNIDDGRGEKLNFTLKEWTGLLLAVIIVLVGIVVYFNNLPETHMYDRYATVIKVGDYSRTKYRDYNRVIDFKLSSGRIISLEQTTLLPPQMGEKVKIEYWKLRYIGNWQTYKMLETGT